MSSRRALVTFFCAIAIGSGAPAAATAGWSAPSLIARGPFIATATTAITDGTVVLLAQDAAGLVVVRRTAGSWASTRIVSHAWDDALDIAIAGDTDGSVSVAWAAPCEDEACTTGGIYLASDDGGSWPLAAERVLAGRWHFPALAVRDGVTHVAVLGHNLHLHHLSDASGHWVDTVVAGTPSLQPSIAIDAHGMSRIGYVQIYSRGSSLRGVIEAREQGDPAAPTFTRRGVPGTLDYETSRVMIGIDPRGRTHLVWDKQDICGVDPCHTPDWVGTWTALWTGSRWSTLRHLSHDLPASAAIDPAGRLHVLTWHLALLSERADGTFARSVAASGATYDFVPSLALVRDGSARVIYPARLRVDGRWTRGAALVRER